ncbi:MAG: DUF4058 family protein [bacterium]|nr:DUF4058 family protein [bacterium]
MADSQALSAAYFELLDRGPFPNQIDPWAEIGTYFHPLHASMIDHLLNTLRKPLQQRGYLVGRETSLQIAQGRQPDVFINTIAYRGERLRGQDYVQAAEAIDAEPGVALDTEPALDALKIRSVESDELVTIIEIISPTNKEKWEQILAYQSYRFRLCGEQGVNVVEIDLTRSVKRLVEGTAVQVYPYHAAIHFPSDLPRLIGFPYGERLKRIALPLRGEVIGIDLQPMYEDAYRRNSTAAWLLNNGAYTEGALPFPSLLTDEKRRTAWQAVARWKSELDDLRTG